MFPFNESTKKDSPMQGQTPAYSVRPQRVSAASMFKNQASQDPADNKTIPSSSNVKTGFKQYNQEKVKQKKFAWLKKTKNMSLINFNKTNFVQPSSSQQLNQKPQWTPPDADKLKGGATVSRVSEEQIAKGLVSVKDIDPSTFETADLTHLKLYLQKVTHQMKTATSDDARLKYRNIVKRAQTTYSRRIIVVKNQKKKALWNANKKQTAQPPDSFSNIKNNKMQAAQPERVGNYIPPSLRRKKEQEKQIVELSDTFTNSSAEGATSFISSFKSSPTAHNFKLTLKKEESKAPELTNTQKIDLEAINEQAIQNTSVNEMKTMRTQQSNQAQQSMQTQQLLKTQQSNQTQQLLQTQQSLKTQQSNQAQQSMQVQQSMQAQQSMQTRQSNQAQQLLQAQQSIQSQQSLQSQQTQQSLQAQQSLQSQQLQQQFPNYQTLGFLPPRQKKMDYNISANPLPFAACYPKGVPLSFLQQQSKNTLVSDTNWPTTSMFIPDEIPYIDVNLEQPAEVVSTYSPTEACQDQTSADADDIIDTDASRKRVSAFQRLGPAAAEKKPKLTINLLFSKDTAGVREVIDDQPPPVHIPVQQRRDIAASHDRIVLKYLPLWPWTRITVRKTATKKTSKTVMLMEMEQMCEGYKSNNNFVKVSIKNYPPHFRKEDVLDIVLDELKDKSIIPCFIEFTSEECYFLVLRSRSALVALHQNGLEIRRGDLRLSIALSLTDLSLFHLDFIPRIVLRKRLTSRYSEDDNKLDLENFCLEPDVSHFIYFPLHNETNQSVLTELGSLVAWERLTELNLSGNHITSLSGFKLPSTTPRLRRLDVSHNRLSCYRDLLACRGLLLASLRLEGNPLCRDYTDPERYVAVAKMLFPTLCQIDGIAIPVPGSLPPHRRNYCPVEAVPLVTSILDVLLPMWQERAGAAEMYHDQAQLTVGYSPDLRYSSLYRRYRSLFARAHSSPRLAESRSGSQGGSQGGSQAARHVASFPDMRHDLYSTIVDVMHYNEDSLILRVSGVLKLTVETLAEDEPLLLYTRTLVLQADRDRREWRIRNEIIYWDAPTKQCADNAFSITTVKPNSRLSLKLESPPDDDLKENLIAIMMKITKLDKKRSERCLELKNWDLQEALKYFMKLLKLNNLNALLSDVKLLTE